MSQQTELPIANGNGHGATTNGTFINGHGVNGTTGGDNASNFAVKAGLARMLKGGVIMDVVNVEQVGISYLCSWNALTDHAERCRPALPKRPALSPSWRSSVYPPIFVRRVVWCECRTPA